MPDQIAFVDIPRPVPKPDEILVQVHAAGLNPIDNMIPKGSFKPILRLQLPATLGSDLAGVAVEVGSRVTRHTIVEQFADLPNAIFLRNDDPVAVTEASLVQPVQACCRWIYFDLPVHTSCTRRHSTI